MKPLKDAPLASAHQLYLKAPNKTRRMLRETFYTQLRIEDEGIASDITEPVAAFRQAAATYQNAKESRRKDRTLERYRYPPARHQRF